MAAGRTSLSVIVVLAIFVLFSSANNESGRSICITLITSYVNKPIVMSYFDPAQNVMKTTFITMRRVFQIQLREVCSNGYYLDKTLQNLTCKPICEPPCINGECTAPETCTCIKGYVFRNQACELANLS